MPETIIQSPIACDLTAIPDNARDGHIATSKQILAVATEVRELDDGFALRLPNDSATLMDAARYIDQERKCCPFFQFTIQVEADGGPLWLHLAGREGVKEFLRGEIGGQLNAEVARRADLL